MILDIAHCKSLIAILGINEAIQCLVFRHHLLVNFWRSSVFFPMINHFSNPLSALGAIAPRSSALGRASARWALQKNLTLALQFSGSSANFKNCRLMTCNLCDVKKCLKVQHKSPNWKQKTLMIWGRFSLMMLKGKASQILWVFRYAQWREKRRGNERFHRRV